MSSADYLVGVEEYELAFVEDVLDDGPVDAQTVYKETIDMSERAIAAEAAFRASTSGGGGPPTGAAGGDLAGTYPNPTLAADYATQAELDAHTADASAAHAASAISIADAGSDFTATDVEGALDELQADNEAHVAAADPHTGYVLESLFDANTVLAADSDDTPAALTMGASTILARLAAGNIKAASTSEIRTLLALVPGADVQAFDAELAAIAGLTSAADSAPYFTGSGTAALATTTAFARTVLDDADAATARATLGVGVTLIASSVLGGAAASFDFTSIPATYNNLRLIVTGATSAATAQVVRLTFNNDGTSIYDSHSLTAGGGLVAGSEALAAAFVRIGAAPPSTATANPGMQTVDIPRYAGTTFHKVLTSTGGYVNGTGAGGVLVENQIGRYRSTTAVSRITIVLASGNWITGSAAYLYGVT